MTVAIFSHPACLEHLMLPGHPESPERLRAVLAALDHERYALLRRIDAPMATREQLTRVHYADLISDVLDGPELPYRQLDPDTAMTTGSAEAALRAAGAVCAAIDYVMTGDTRRAFCAVRPPGHHATADTAMGFCLFNSVAVGAAYAMAAHGLSRVAIMDFDVHHGNGTQDIFWNDPRVLYASIHQSPLYPDSGRVDETGSANNIVNAPLPSGAGSAEFRAAVQLVVIPALDAFAPELLIISAGFDAHRLDPLANLNLEGDDYGWVTTQLVALAERHCGGRIVSSLEGGYSLAALRESTQAHVDALMR
ncbi:MAG: histone deacetylase family protein [Dokdonella sp.]